MPVLAHHIHKPVACRAGSLDRGASLRLTRRLEHQDPAGGQGLGIQVQAFPLMVFCGALTCTQLSAQNQHLRTFFGHPQQGEDRARHLAGADLCHIGLRKMNTPQLRSLHMARQVSNGHTIFVFLDHAKAERRHRMPLQRCQTRQLGGQLGVVQIIFDTIGHSRRNGGNRIIHGSRMCFGLGWRP